MSAHDLPKPVRVAVLCTEEPGDYLAMQVMYCLAKIGAHVHVLSDGKEPLYKHSRYVSAYSVAPFPDSLETADSFAPTLSDYVRKNKINVVCPSDIFTAKLAARIAPKVPDVAFSPVADPKTLDELDDKWVFYGLLQRLGLPTPVTMRIEDWSQATRARSEGLPFPVMLKPLALSGGRGIVRCDDIAAIDAQLGEVGEHHAFPLLVQEFREGLDAGVALMAENGRLLTHSAQIQYKSPGGASRVEFVDHPEAVAIAERIVAETGYSGPGFIDMRLDRDTKAVHVLEFNPRYWYSVSVPMWNGCNYVEAGVRRALGLDVDNQGASLPGRVHHQDALHPKRLLKLVMSGALSGADLDEGWMRRSDSKVRKQMRARFAQQQRTDMERRTA